jgi:hypothetical protein
MMKPVQLKQAEGNFKRRNAVKTTGKRLAVKGDAVMMWD